MKTLILYASKRGATRQIAERIAKQLNGSVLCDITQTPVISLTDYDCVILGGAVTAGLIPRKLKRFVQNSTNELLAKRLGIFVSGLNANGLVEYLSQNFPAPLLEAATAKAFLGGIYDPALCSFFARAIIKAAAKLDKYTSTIDESEIVAFARKMDF